jgi:molybdate transport system substrate-binding protein
MSELTLLSGGAAHGLFKMLAQDFESKTGYGLSGTFGAVGAMREGLEAGQPADVLILTRQIIDELSLAGDVIPDSIADIGIVQTALAIRSGDPVIVLDGAAALVDALLAADEIHFPDPARATAGIHFSGVIDRLGLTERIADTLRLHPNGTTAMAALSHSTARRPLGCTQVTEILAEHGAKLVAPLPDGLDLTTVYTGAVCTRSVHIDAARAFVAYITSARTLPQRRECGFE